MYPVVILILCLLNALQEALGQICDYSEAGITVRGTYVNPGKEPKDGERKLYLAIEATSERAIQKAKSEVVRLIKEELVRLVSCLVFSQCHLFSLLLSPVVLYCIICKQQ